jgi:hypothetical protein
MRVLTGASGYEGVTLCIAETDERGWDELP